MKRIARFVRAEAKAWLKWVVMYLPVSPLGYRVRRWYWSRALPGARRVEIGFGTNIIGSELLFVGDDFQLGDFACLAVTDSPPVLVGDRVAMAHGTYLRSANHRHDNTDLPASHQGHTSRQIEYNGRLYSIVIEDDVWIAANCVILSGAFIGRGAVVAAGSVVSSTVPSYAVVAGNPARVTADRRKSG